MHRLFGLPRDPFALVCDGALFWESPERCEARQRALSALRDGSGVWVRGEAGSGRGALLSRLAEDLALEGRRVVFVEGAAPAAGPAFLDRLLTATGAACPGADLLSSAEELYARLVEAFCQSGPTVMVPATEPLGPGASEEAEILCRLRLVGRALAVLALAGQEPPPFPGLVEVSLPKPSVEDLTACLAHRAAVCGQPDVLTPERLAEVAAGAGGLGDAMGRARAELARLAFERGAGQLPDLTRVSPGVGGDPPILEPRELGEVDRLLQALEPDPTAQSGQPHTTHARRLAEDRDRREKVEKRDQI